MVCVSSQPELLSCELFQARARLAQALQALGEQGTGVIAGRRKVLLC